MGAALQSVEANIHQALTAITTDVDGKLKALLLPNEVYDFNEMMAKVFSHESHAQYALLEIGRIFAAAKIVEGALFAKRIEDIGRTPAYAYRMIALFEKLGGSRTKLIGVGVSKALELIREDSEDLDRLAEGGAINGLTLDDIDKMTVRDVREQLRKARMKLADQKETTDELVKVRDVRIREFQKQLLLGDKYPAAEKAGELMSDLTRASATLAASIHTIMDRAQQFTAMLQDSQLPEETIELFKAVVKNAEFTSNQLQGLSG